MVLVWVVLCVVIGWGWVGLVIGHLGIIFAMYFTFKQFHNIPYVKKPDPNDPPLYDDVWYGS